ncbi:MAG: Crp/Fnr family transcriptional regulator [Phycisphaerae bacterium]
MVTEADIKSVAGVLQYVPLFASLTADQLRGVADLAQARTIKAKTLLIRQRAAATTLYVVVGGQIRASEITADGQEILYRFIGPGQMIGGMAAVGGLTYPITAHAVRDSRLLAWGTESMQRMMEQYPLIALNAMRLMVARIEELQARYVALATQQVRQRIANTLLRLTEQCGHRAPDGILLDMRLSRQDLAEMTGTTLYTVSRLLNQWQRQNIITLRNRNILIRKPHDLVCIAQADEVREDR